MGLCVPQAESETWANRWSRTGREPSLWSQSSGARSRLTGGGVGWRRGERSSVFFSGWSRGVGGVVPSGSEHGVEEEDGRGG